MTALEIQSQICLYLEKYPQFCLFTAIPAGHYDYTSRFIRKGWPQICGQWCARPLYIAVREPQGSISAQQWQLIDRARGMGAIAFTATSVDDVVRELKSFIGEPPPAA